jgi:hypothetical protein
VDDGLIGGRVVHVAPRCAVAAFEGGTMTTQWQGLSIAAIAQKLHKGIASTAQCSRHIYLQMK